MAKLVSASAFAAFLAARLAAHDGYIMGATGQNPRSWSATSWWFRQYRKGKDRTKALFWRAHAPRVWDCNGLAEGYYKDLTGISINQRARNNYASWCGVKGKGLIPAKYRVPGAAVFHHNGLYIHHVGYLVAPVVPGKPDGDWYVIEARGVHYGVIKTKLYDKGRWNRWGLMTKYFDYAQAGAEPTPDPITPTAPIPAPLNPEKPYMANWVIATAPVNVRTGPGENYRRYVTLLPGTGLMYDGAISGEWYAVMWRGKRHWVSSRYARIEVREKPIVDLSVYDYVTDWPTFSKWISFVFHRVGVRSIRSNGKIKRDGKFPVSAAIMQKLGIPFGAYFYGRAKTVAGACEEADCAMMWAEPYGVKVYAYDIETPTNNQAAVQAFIDRITEKTGKPCGIYAGRRWNQVNGDKLRKAFAWCPYYRKNGGGTHGDREPSHPHDFHQYSCSARFPGKTDDTDVSHVSGTGHGIEWLRSGGKEGV